MRARLTIPDIRLRGGHPACYLVGILVSANELLGHPRFRRAATMSEAHEERELIFASFADATMGVVAEKALREWDHQIDSIHVGNIAVVSRDETGEVRVLQAGHISPSRGALFGLVAGGLVGAALIGLPLTVAVGTAAGVQAAAVAAGALTSAAASAQATTLAAGAGLATAVASAVTGAVGAALGTAAGGIAALFGFKTE